MSSLCPPGRSHPVCPFHLIRRVMLTSTESGMSPFTCVEAGLHSDFLRITGIHTNVSGDWTCADSASERRSVASVPSSRTCTDEQSKAIGFVKVRCDQGHIRELKLTISEQLESHSCSFRRADPRVLALYRDATLLPLIAAPLRFSLPANKLFARFLFSHSLLPLADRVLPAMRCPMSMPRCTVLLGVSPLNPSDTDKIC